MSLYGLLSATPFIGYAAPAAAYSGNVQMALQNYGDLSMFQQAMVTTGQINELNDNEHYTIFAPINASFVTIHPQAYPCFYSEQCRPQIAALLRNHIIPGRHDLRELVTAGSGVQTLGPRRIHVDEPYRGDYTVDGQKILSKSEINGNIIYRIDGVIRTPSELAQFQSVNTSPDEVVTTRKTVTTTTYHAPGATPPVPAMNPVMNDGSESMTTTVTKTYSTEQ
jgi:uncharacterized surface protein with fasciclin (FAS1) repeats